MKRTSTFIGSGLFFIFFLAVITISLMNRFMNRETEIDVHKIAETYLQGVADAEMAHYETIAELRFDQLDYLQQEILKVKERASKEAVFKVAEEAADFQEMENCSLLFEDGEVLTLCGSPFLILKKRSL